MLLFQSFALVLQQFGMLDLGKLELEIERELHTFNRLELDSGALGYVETQNRITLQNVCL